MDSILTIDDGLVSGYVQTLVMNTFGAYQQRGSGGVSWQDAELAVFLVFIFGEFQKSSKGARRYSNFFLCKYQSGSDGFVH